MTDPLDSWSTYLEVDPDFNQVDLQAEIQRLFVRQKAIDAMLRGEIPPDYVGDMLIEHGIEPTEWLAESLDNLAEEDPECLGCL